MPSPLPTQLSGALFLAQRQAALLADAPRVGKTGAAILGADYILARRILVVTTASGRAVWMKGFADWSPFCRSAAIVTPATAARFDADVAIVGWPSVADPKVRSVLLSRMWDLVLLDEAHNAKNFDAKRTQAVYGVVETDGTLNTGTAILAHASAVWPLSGTPMPHNPSDLYPMLRALAPERLGARGDWPDVTAPGDFLHRYCQVRMKKLSNFRRIPVVVGSKNLEELRARVDGFLLRRTQADVGIREPVYDTLPLLVTDKMRRIADGDLERGAVLDAAARGDTKTLEMHLGPLRRLTGEMKAGAVIEAVRDEFDGGLDKIVLMFWHKDVGEILRAGLAAFGVVGIDGSTPDAARAAAVARFQSDPACRVFVGQIQAAGEAIDLSAAAELWFVETSFTPKDQVQAALRITNHSQQRQAVVKVVTLAGSIDEAVQARLLMLMTAIREVVR